MCKPPQTEQLLSCLNSFVCGFHVYYFFKRYILGSASLLRLPNGHGYMLNIVPDFVVFLLSIGGYVISPGHIISAYYLNKNKKKMLIKNPSGHDLHWNAPFNAVLSQCIN